MEGYLELLIESFTGTIRDVMPIIIVLVFFQAVAIRKKMPNMKQILFGMALVIVGLAIFLVGLEKCIFPIGKSMANQLSDPTILAENNPELKTSLEQGIRPGALVYVWAIVFAFFIGFSTTMAEPSLLAVALKASEISTGSISPLGLRVAVALGVAVGVGLGAYRIVVGTPLEYYIISGYIFLMIQTYFAPKFIIPLAYDSGGVTTSTVTVPLVVALGIGLASNVPGRSPLLDGFGLIAFASLFPIISVLGYAMIGAWLAKRKLAAEARETQQ